MAQTAIQRNHLLGAMPPADVDRFFSDLHPVSLAMRDVLYRVGAPLEHVYFVEEGVVSILTTMTTGVSIEAGMVGTEGVAGLPALLGEANSGQTLR